MSNAMRFGKRSLAGVAAGALALGMLTIASAPAASAQPSIKPKASLTGTVAPVRTTFSGSTLESVPFSQVSWTSSGTLATSDTAVVTLTTAPSAIAQLALTRTSLISTATVVGANNIISNADDSDTLGTVATGTVIMGLSGTTARLGLAANTAGTYAGTITTHSNTNGGALDVVSFSFTTSGRPASMVLAPASQTVPTGGVAPLTATLLDSAGVTTQPSSVDSVALSSTGAAGTFANAASAAITSLPGRDDSSATGLFDGSSAFGFANGGTAGTSTISAAPRGTLSAGGVTTQTATVTATGSINTTAVLGLDVSTTYADDTGASPNSGVDIPVGTTSVGIAVVGTTAQAGTTVRFRAIASQGTPSSSAPAYINVTLNSQSVGTGTITLGGLAPTSGTYVNIVQVNSANTPVNTGSVFLGLTVTPRAVSAADVIPTPGGSIVQVLGTPTPVSVLVTDQYGDPASGAVVSALRSTSSSPLSTATTGATGTATVTVSNATGLASGGVEVYSFQVTPIGQTSFTATRTLTVTYTTSGAVTSMAVTVVSNSGATSPILNTSATPTLIPYILVPYNGTATTLGGANSVWNTATGALVTGGTLAGNLIEFTALPNPANTVTVTTPEGVFVSKSATSLTANAWNAGTRSVTVNANQSVYVFATKAGQHEVTFTSGAIVTKVPIRVATTNVAAYNIAVSPTSRSLEEGAFGTVTLTVTDVFGNPVPGTTAGTGDVTAAASGEVLLSGLSATGNLTTGAAGTSTVTLIAGKPGQGKVTFTPTAPTTNLALAWRAGYVPPTGAPAPVKSAEATITVSTVAEKSIAIIGERTDVSGKSGIRVDGDTEGIESGKTVIPYVRFPGQTEYAQGSARPTIDAAGNFEWSRKTGKKSYVYFTSDDGKVVSNRIIIAAS